MPSLDTIALDAIPAIPADRNPDHHIWCNNGTYFLHLTVLWAGRHKRRLRKSLKTKSLEEARRRRDEMIRRLEQEPELRLLLRA